MIQRSSARAVWLALQTEALARHQVAVLDAHVGGDHLRIFCIESEHSWRSVHVRHDRIRPVVSARIIDAHAESGAVSSRYQPVRTAAWEAVSVCIDAPGFWNVVDEDDAAGAGALWVLERLREGRHACRWGRAPLSARFTQMGRLLFELAGDGVHNDETRRALAPATSGR
jgi:hypothetical protein